MNTPAIDLTFSHTWSAEILPQRPLILPKGQFVYPRQAEEVERGALEVGAAGVQVEGPRGLDRRTGDAPGRGREMGA